MEQILVQTNAYRFERPKIVAANQGVTDLGKTESERWPRAVSLLIVTILSVLLWAGIILLGYFCWRY